MRRFILKGPLHICWSLIHGRHRFPTCPDRDLPLGSINPSCPPCPGHSSTLTAWSSQWRWTVLLVLWLCSQWDTVPERDSERRWWSRFRWGGGASPALLRSRYALRLDKLHKATAPPTGICRQQRSPLCNLCPLFNITYQSIDSELWLTDQVEMTLQVSADASHQTSASAYIFKKSHIKRSCLIVQ